MFSCKLYVGVLCPVYCFDYAPVGYYGCCLAVLCLSNDWWIHNKYTESAFVGGCYLH